MSGENDARSADPVPFEPSLPASMRNRQEGLRSGWTTGTCASAAAKAAVLTLVTGHPVTSVEVALPFGDRVFFAVERCERGKDWAEAVVVKDAGDDPDVTHGAHLTARVRFVATPGVQIEAGVGVGRVTKPGLGLPVGSAAVNSVPRRMIREMLLEGLAQAAGQGGVGAARQGVAHSLPGSVPAGGGREGGEVSRGENVQGEPGLEVTISVPGGEEMAKRTTNPRLGIMGGISILGTRGIVKPFSTAAYRASIVQAIAVAKAQGETEMVFSTGGRTERGAVAAMPWLSQSCFVEVGDHTGLAFKHAARAGMERATLVAMMGKMTKLAAGIMMTHYTRSKIDHELLSSLARSVQAPEALVQALEEANTARHAFELIVAAGEQQFFRVLVERAGRMIGRWLDGALPVEAILTDFDGCFVAGTAGARWEV